MVVLRSEGVDRKGGSRARASLGLDSAEDVKTTGPHNMHALDSREMLKEVHRQIRSLPPNISSLHGSIAGRHPTIQQLHVCVCVCVETQWEKNFPTATQATRAVHGARAPTIIRKKTGVQDKEVHYLCAYSMASVHDYIHSQDNLLSIDTFKSPSGVYESTLLRQDQSEGSVRVGVSFLLQKHHSAFPYFCTPE